MQALAMGGYGSYVWTAFGFTLVLMVGLLWLSWRAQRQRDMELAALRQAVRGDQARPIRRRVATRPAASGPPPADGPSAHGPSAHGMATGQPTSGT